MQVEIKVNQFLGIHILINQVDWIKSLCFSRFFAEYQTGLQEFYPKLVAFETRIGDGLSVPEVYYVPVLYFTGYNVDSDNKLT